MNTPHAAKAPQAYDCVITGFGSHLTICENVARAAALCDLEAPGWGEPWFPLVLLLIPSSQISVWQSCGIHRHGAACGKKFV